MPALLESEITPTPVLVEVNADSVTDDLTRSLTALRHLQPNFTWRLVQHRAHAWALRLKQTEADPWRHIYAEPTELDLDAQAVKLEVVLALAGARFPEEGVGLQQLEIWLGPEDHALAVHRLALFLCAEFAVRPGVDNDCDEGIHRTAGICSLRLDEEVFLLPDSSSVRIRLRSKSDTLVDRTVELPTLVFERLRRHAAGASAGRALFCVNSAQLKRVLQEEVCT